MFVQDKFLGISSIKTFWQASGEYKFISKSVLVHPALQKTIKQIFAEDLMHKQLTPRIVSAALHLSSVRESVLQLFYEEPLKDSKSSPSSAVENAE